MTRDDGNTDRKGFTLVVKGGSHLFQQHFSLDKQEML